MRSITQAWCTAQSMAGATLQGYAARELYTAHLSIGSLGILHQGILHTSVVLQFIMYYLQVLRIAVAGSGYGRARSLRLTADSVTKTVEAMQLSSGGNSNEVRHTCIKAAEYGCNLCIISKHP